MSSKPSATLLSSGSTSLRRYLKSHRQAVPGRALLIPTHSCFSHRHAATTYCLPSTQQEGVELYAKAEYFNPLSSVKDRLAVGIIEDAERSGALKPGMTVVEATSGNTGIAVAMVCAQKGYPCVITMAETFSIERRKIMRALGAKVVLTPAKDRGSGMVKKARELAAEHGWFLCRQFENQAGPAYHAQVTSPVPSSQSTLLCPSSDRRPAPPRAQTTGPEILSDFAGRPLDYWVTGTGTGGTLQGAGKVLKLARPDLKIVVSEPANAAIVSSGNKTERNADDSPASTHPDWEPHPIQGWTPDFIPKITEDAMGMDLVSEIVPVTGAEAIETALRLAREEGLFTGISGGASVAAALKVCAAAPKGSVVLTMLPDTAERYLSTPLFASIEAEMSEEELSISKSTPLCQFEDA